MEKTYKFVFYLLIFLMVSALFVQLYHIINSYNINKKTFTNLVNTIFNSSVEEYYIDLHNDVDQFKVHYDIESSIKKYDSIAFGSLNKEDALREDIFLIDTIVHNKKQEELLVGLEFVTSNNVFAYNNQQKFKLNNFSSYLGPKNKSENLEKYITDIVLQSFISQTVNRINLKDLYDKIRKKLNKNKIKLNYGLTLTFVDDSNSDLVKKTLYLEDIGTDYLNIETSFNLLSDDVSLMLLFQNPIINILQKSFLQIFISFVFSALMLACILFFVRFIKKQKRIEQIRNDLVSNITHELKTPISTAVVAIEAIQYFNAYADKHKQKEYLEISKNQMTKLSYMVDKILDSATLNSDGIKLDFQYVDIKSFLDNIIQNFRLITLKTNNIVFKFDIRIPCGTMLNIDSFHLENALSNILDNSIKYGGKNVLFKAKLENDEVIFNIIDDGIGIPVKHANKIFHQFYRVPNGNKHDTKGFGIGLYYTKNIIDRHNGKIFLDIENTKKTVFIVTLKK